MRFITEFELGYPGWSGVTEEGHKANCKFQLGINIAQVFGWENPVNNNPDHHKLEIEAFPMEKWIEFKNKLFTYLDDELMPSGTKILEMIKDLEFYSNNKQAIDKLTNPK